MVQQVNGSTAKTESLGSSPVTPPHQGKRRVTTLESSPDRHNGTMACAHPHTNT